MSAGSGSDPHPPNPKATVEAWAAVPRTRDLIRQGLGWLGSVATPAEAQRWARGRMTVAERQALAEKAAVRASATLRDLARGLGHPPGDARAWASASWKAIASAHTAAALAVANGRPLAKPEVEALRAAIKRQLGYLERFRRQLDSGAAVPGPRAVARAAMYGRAAWATAQNVARAKALASGQKAERRRLGTPEHHCPDCPGLAALGWAPIGSLPEIGASRCLTNCRCRFEYRLQPADALSRQARRKVARSKERARLARKETAAPEPTPKPPPREPGSAEPRIPDGPIAERIEAYQLGDRKIAAITREIAAHEAEIQRLEALKVRALKTESRVVFALEKARRKSPAEVARLQTELLAAEEELRAATKAVAVAREIPPRVLVERAIGRPPGSPSAFAPPEIAFPVGDPRRQAAESALAWLGRLVAPHPEGPQTTRFVGLPLEAIDRSYYLSSDDTIRQAMSAGTDVAVHELGHALDEQRGWLKRSLEFLKYRVGDEPPRSLREVYPNADYDAWEKGRQDEFGRAFGEARKWYVGKDYGGRSTEIVAMGLQELYNNPAGFAKNDPQYCKFLLGLLDGSLR